MCDRKTERITAYLKTQFYRIFFQSIICVDHSLSLKRIQEAKVVFFQLKRVDNPYFSKVRCKLNIFQQYEILYDCYGNFTIANRAYLSNAKNYKERIPDFLKYQSLTSFFIIVFYNVSFVIRKVKQTSFINSDTTMQGVWNYRLSNLKCNLIRHKFSTIFCENIDYIINILT